MILIYPEWTLLFSALVIAAGRNGFHATQKRESGTPQTPDEVKREADRIIAKAYRRVKTRGTDQKWSATRSRQPVQ